MKTIILNALVFQFGWLCCVLSGAENLPWLGTITALLIVIWHIANTTNKTNELTLILIAGLIGIVWDSILVYAGALQYPSGVLIEHTAPHWIVAIWLLFATTLNVSLRWLKNRPLLASILGAVSGPAAYYAGYKLGGVQIPDMTTAMILLATGWAIWLPLLMHLSNRFDGSQPEIKSFPVNGWKTNV